MRCTIVGCGGECEDRLVTHTVRHLGEIIVIDNVPAEVCGLCGEALLSPDTVRRIEALLDNRSAPKRTVPLYEFVA